MMEPHTAAHDLVRSAKRMANKMRSSGRTSQWLLLILLLALAAWYVVPDIRWRLTRGDAAPRAVVARGDLAGDEQATIEIFERSKGSVVYITTRARVVDFWTRAAINGNFWRSLAQQRSGSSK